MRRYFPDHSKCCANYNPQFRVGDRVVYAQRFLESIAETPTGPLCHVKGVVVGIKILTSEVTLVEVDWGDDSTPSRVNSKNLAKPGTLASMNH